ncbi:AraC family transcriptional regulator [Paenibacillus sp. MZ04-78.2]|uniref:AraC family transcriptional regulator n=1 Tax=Paenibacillus sp. MZ04-78.2 TaxID=2962034 RepID=UPI0020B7B27E|nr:AraC family transcriptional regulator [Paenibacillus sp. MZ04-78.2]MCP3775977.1 AraC family transcriptional regulator [Paenibacillus sp. MZ04-78.2]
MFDHPHKIQAYLNEIVPRLQNQSASFTIHYWGIEPAHFDNPVHQHSFFEICYVLEGEGMYMDGDDLFPLDKETLFLSRPGIRHQIRSKQGMFLLYVAFEVDEENTDPAIVRQFRQLAVVDRIVIYDAYANPATLIWTALLKHVQEPVPITEHYVKSAALSLLFSFCSTFQAEAPASGFGASGYKPAAYALNRAIRFVKDNLSHSMTLAEVAVYLHLSSRHLSRLFQQELGMSYIHFVQQEKIRRAVYLLKHSDLSLIEIAEKSGFFSIHYFTRSFSRKMGMPPGKYREAMHEKKASE